MGGNFMTAKEIMEKLYGKKIEEVDKNSCDCIKAGREDKIVKKICVTMFATVDVIKKAIEMNADMIITHEPLYYRHMDDAESEIIINAKKSLLDKSGITVYRYHDHSHFSNPDIIIEGELKKLRLKGKVIHTGRVGVSDIILDEPKTAAEIAEICKTNLNIDSVRIAGSVNKKASIVTFTPGALGNIVLKELQREDSQIVICGETCEWQICEYARDASQLGLNKSLIPLGHAVSERDGMEYTAEILNNYFPELEFVYIDCENVFTFV